MQLTPTFQLACTREHMHSPASHISCNDAHPQMSTRKRDKKKTQQSAAAERMKQLRLLLKTQARLTSKPSGRLRSKQSCVDSCSVRRSTGIVRVVKWMPTADSVVDISCVERGARRAREGVRSTAYPPAHPVDGSQPRGRARRTSLNGENGSACAGLSTHSHAHACVHCPTWPAPQSPSVRGRCAQTRCNSDAAGGSRPCRVAIAPPCVSFATFLWLWMGTAVPRSVLCVRSRTGLDARANLLSRLWAFRAVLGVHVDHHSHQ